jgi:hypothetical protein
MLLGTADRPSPGNQEAQAFSNKLAFRTPALAFATSMWRTPMNLPTALPGLARKKDFWARFFWFREDSVTYADLETYRQPVPQEYRELLGESLPGCRIDYPVGEGYGLRLEFGLEFGDFQLNLLRPKKKPVQIAWDDQAHWHPHVLRWEELDTICRCVTLADPSLCHPGLPLLLLYRFTPITEAEPAEAAFALLRAGWRGLGITTEKALSRLCNRLDAREQGFEWREIKAGWTLSQEHSLAHRRGCYSLRQTRYGKFPFADFNAMVERARRACAEVVRPAWKTPAVRSLTAAAMGGELDAMPALADALEEAGCDQTVILAHLRDTAEPARGAWVVELLAETGWGEVLRRCPHGRKDDAG